MSRVRRKKKNAAKTRLIRAGLWCGGLGLAVWLVTLAITSGAADRFGSDIQTRLYDVTARAGFQVDQIYIKGRERTDPETLRTLLNIKKGDPILAFKPDHAMRFIEQISWVKSVRVERRLPNTIHIQITERQPLAIWQHDGELTLIDTEGVALAEGNLKEFMDLPIIAGENAPEQAKAMLELVNAEPEIARRLEGATYISDRRWNLKLENGIDLKLPETNVGLALSRLANMQEQDSVLDKDIVGIDLRTPDRIVVQPSERASQKQKNDKKNKENGRSI